MWAANVWAVGVWASGVWLESGSPPSESRSLQETISIADTATVSGVTYPPVADSISITDTPSYYVSGGGGGGGGGVTSLTGGVTRITEVV